MLVMRPTRSIVAEVVEPMLIAPCSGDTIQHDTAGHKHESQNQQPCQYDQCRVLGHRSGLRERLDYGNGHHCTEYADHYGDRTEKLERTNIPEQGYHHSQDSQPVDKCGQLAVRSFRPGEVVSRNFINRQAVFQCVDRELGFDLESS